MLNRVHNITFNRYYYYCYFFQFYSAGIHSFSLTPAKSTDNRTGNSQFYYPKKTKRAVLFYYYYSYYYYFAEHFVTMRIRGCNTLLFHLCPTAQKEDLEVGTYRSRPPCPVNSRKLLFNTQADFTGNTFRTHRKLQ